MVFHRSTILTFACISTRADRDLWHSSVKDLGNGTHSD